MMLVVVAPNENAHQPRAIMPAPTQTYVSSVAPPEGTARAAPRAPSGPSAACAGEAPQDQSLICRPTASARKGSAQSGTYPSAPSDRPSRTLLVFAHPRRPSDRACVPWGIGNPYAAAATRAWQGGETLLRPDP
jgi:hypothetical protein